MIRIVLSLWVISMTVSAFSQEASEPPRWAIVLHGGAGGDPDSWTDAKREARRKGLRAALEIGRDVLSGDGTALDAVEAVIRSLEDDASFNAGRGAVMTTDRTFELDASIMDGKDRSCGAVAGVKSVKNPITAARLVMTDTKHVLLAGPGADAFAASKNLPVVQPDYFARFPGPPNPGEIVRFGTVGCVALDSRGNLAGGTSTGGTSKKLPGRVGDSPIVGAGTFADNSSCAVSGTGIGEEYIRNAVAYDIAAQMQYGGRTLRSAVTDVMQKTLRPGDGGVIALSHAGESVMQHTTPGMSCGRADSSGLFEVFLRLSKGGVEAAREHDDISDEQVVRELILQQAEDWNAGDLDAFMNVYWKSDQLTFSSGGQITRGWQNTLDRYRKRYPDRKAMGKVAFTDLEFLQLDEGAMQVLGKWSLQREVEPIGGRFTLVFRKQPAGWRIVHDHTSLLED